MTLSNLTHHSVRLVRPARSPLFARALLAAAGVCCLLAAGAAGARADTTAQPLPLTQAWSDSGLITTDDDWSAVPGIVGYRGDSEAADGVDPATVTDDLSEIVDVNANRSSPDNLFSGGVTEFELADPAVALQGSATADAPHLVARVSTAGRRAITVSYRLRDLDGSADDAVQAVALQYRVGDSGPYANVPARLRGRCDDGPRGRHPGDRDRCHAPLGRRRPAARRRPDLDRERRGQRRARGSRRHLDRRRSPPSRRGRRRRARRSRQLPWGAEPRPARHRRGRCGRRLRPR
jgi:hypothetical protein